MKDSNKKTIKEKFNSLVLKAQKVAKRQESEYNEIVIVSKEDLELRALINNRLRNLTY